MSRSYETNVSYDPGPTQAELERERRIEQERQAIQSAQQEIEQTQSRLAQVQRAREAKLKARTQQIRHQASQQSKELEAQHEHDMQALDLEIAKLEHQITCQSKEREHAEMLLSSIENMSASTYMVFNAVQHVFKDWHSMLLAEVEVKDGEMYARFAHEDVDQVVGMILESKTPQRVRLDVTHGFEGNECDVFMEQVTDELSQRGYSLGDDKTTQQSSSDQTPTSNVTRHSTRRRTRN